MAEHPLWKKFKNRNWKNIPWLSMVQYEVFTKKNAEDAIAKEIPNQRKLNKQMVEKFVESMNMGAWWTYCPSQIPLIFTGSMERMNGNTRLNALLLSNLKSLEFPVIHNVSAEAYSFVDNDMRIRNPKEALNDLLTVTRDTARVNGLHAIIIGNPKYSSPTALLREKITGEDMYKAVVEWADSVIPKAGKIGRAPYAVPFMYVYRVDPEFADKWAKAWVEGDLAKAPAFRVMRDNVLSSMDRPRSGKESLAHIGGGRLYTHEGPSMKMLNVLALLHQDKKLGRSIPENHSGLKYWSELAEDGAYDAYRNNPEES
jgi:hypothetical protein